MRFVSLELSAIGPYPGKITIPFEKLGGISLVCGKTGSGKTFIFDAVTFALYGRSSGDDRDVNGFRSTFASQDAESYVRLVFEHDGGTYTILRTPAYMRSKLRGKGLIKEPASVQLDTPDGRSLVKTEQVMHEISSIVGLTVDQWRQVVMLAQGKFRAFLEANNKDRGEILESIFGIKVFSDMVEELKNRSKSAVGQIQTAGIRISDEARRYKCEGRPDAAEYESILKDTRSVVDADGRIFELISRFEAADAAELESAVGSEKAAAEEAVKAAEAYNAAKVVNDAFDALTKAQSTFDELSSEVPVYEERAHALERARSVLTNVKPAVDTYLRTEKVLKEAQNAAEAYKTELASAKTNADKAEADVVAATEAASAIITLRDRSSKISGTLEGYVKKDNAAKKVAAAQRLVDQCKNELGAYQTEHDAIRMTVDGYRKYLSDNNYARGEHPKVQSELDDLGKRLVAVAALKTALTKYESAVTVRDKAQKELEDAKVRALDTKETYSARYDQYICGIAGTLSGELKEGVPCPVCGATHHPSPAVKLDGCPTKEDLKTLEEDMNRARAVYDEAVERASEVGRELAAVEANVRDRAEAAGVDIAVGDASNRKTVDAEEAHIREQKSKLTQRKKELEAVLSEIHRIDSYFEDNKDPTSDSQKKLDLKKQALSDAEGALKAAVTEQNAHSENLEFSSKAEAEKEIRRLNADAGRLQKAKETADTNFSDAKQKFSAAEAKVKAATEAVSKTEAERDSARSSLDQVFVKFEIADMNAYNEVLRKEEDINAESEAIKKHRDTVSQAKGALDSALKTVEGKERPVNLDELQVNAAAADEKRKSAVEVRSGVENRIGHNRDVKSNLKAMFSKVKTDLHDLMELSDLAEVAENGAPDTNGAYMGFADYVRSKYFDTILEFTRGRLEHMTNGRYELRRARDISGGRSSHMLDLEVVDYEAPGCPPRAVSSLSGGESFKTALALALGFSDAIQEHASGQKIDALFIDEGFGTLDEDESLDQALDVLQDLSGSSKTVCVISHVVKLREKIPKQILVTNVPKKGSSLEIITD